MASNNQAVPDSIIVETPKIDLVHDKTDKDSQKSVNLSQFREKGRNFLRIKNKVVCEFLAELFGTFFFLSFGLSSIAQFVFSEQSDFLPVNISFAFGLTIAIICVGKISGAHLNPAVSLSMVLLGRISIFQFFIYLIGQLLGAFLASVMVYLVYLNQLQNYPDGMHSIKTAGIFATYPNQLDSTDFIFTYFFDQFFATLIFVIAILGITDKKNTDISHPVVAILIGLSLLCVGTSFGYNCGYAVNPARDFAPRLFTLIAGWGTKVFSAGNYFFWIPIIAPMIGSVFGTVIYYLFIGIHLV